MTEKALNDLLNDADFMAEYYTELIQNFEFCLNVIREEESNE